MTLWRLAQR